MTSSRALFLYNHDAAHQAAHIAGIMRELAIDDGHVTAIAATGTPAIAETVRGLVGEAAADRIEWIDLSLPRTLDRLLALPDRILPARRLARLRRAEAVFAKADIIISTERTCLRARRRLRAAMGQDAPLFAYVPHGSGDRNVAYHRELAQYDHHLLSGRKLVEEMIAHGIARAENCHIIGYAKFDTIAGREPLRLFDNDRPTIVYNPHFDPRLSSWYDHGPALLTALSGMGDRFNVVFAPHVMLFRKRLHISPEYRIARLRPDIPAAAIEASHILIDVDGPRLFDMTYTASADIYVGDVSSQVYEFLARPRPVYFLDAAAQGAGAYSFWTNGPVHTSVPDLIEGLHHWREVGETHAPIQKRLFAYTIDIEPGRSASQRGAATIMDILRR